MSQYRDHNDFESAEEYDKAVEEVLDLADYLEGHTEDIEARLAEIDKQHQDEQGD